VAAQQYPPDRW
jgi:hypothetical protein